MSGQARPFFARVRVRSISFTAALLIGIVGMTPPASAAAPMLTLYGRGWGHAVGLSQWGAKGLADKQWSFSRILALFYRGTAIQSSTAIKEVRVGLLQEQGYIDVTGNGPFDLYDHTGVRKATGQSGQTWRIKPAGSGSTLVVTNPQGVVSFTSTSPVTVRYESHSTTVKLPKTGYSYKHGRIDFDVNTATGKERAILIVPFEQYLYGLGEMPSSWANEALKAQAIAGRTYATEKILRLGQNRPVCNCGMYASTLDQAYVGTAQEVTRWVSAVDNTKNQVVTYQSKPIQAFYSASDGGFNENNENVWGGTALYYLRGACDPGDYASGANPNSNWIVQMDGNQMSQRLQAGGINVGTVTKLEIISPRGKSGRILRVIDATHGGITVTGTTGTARVSGNTFQSLLGLKSTFISHSIKGEIRNRWDSLNCAPALPLAEARTWRDLDGTVRGSAQNFSNGRLFFNSSTSKVFWTWGPILARFDDLRSHGTDLGLPTSDVMTITGGRRSNFERGYIIWNSSTNTTSVTLYH